MDVNPVTMIRQWWGALASIMAAIVSMVGFYQLTQSSGEIVATVALVVGMSVLWMMSWRLLLWRRIETVQLIDSTERVVHRFPTWIRCLGVLGLAIIPVVGTASYTFGRSYISDKARLAQEERARDIDREASDAGFNASYHLATGSLDAALKKIGEAIALNPSDTDALRLRAEIFEKQGQPQAAIDDFSAVLSIDPSNESALHNRSRLFAKLQEYERARQDADQWIRIATDDDTRGRALFNRALIAIEQHISSETSCLKRRRALTAKAEEVLASERDALGVKDSDAAQELERQQRSLKRQLENVDEECRQESARLVPNILDDLSKAKPKARGAIAAQVEKLLAEYSALQADKTTVTPAPLEEPTALER